MNDCNPEVRAVFEKYQVESFRLTPDCALSKSHQHIISGAQPADLDPCPPLGIGGFGVMTLRATATSYSAIADRYARGAGVSARRRHRPDGVPPPGHARALRAARVRRRARSARPVFGNVEVRSVALDGGQRDRARGD